MRHGGHFRLEMYCREARHYSSSLTGVPMPEAYSADNLRAAIVDALEPALASGLSKTASRVFRIGHLGDFTDLVPAGTLSGVERGLGHGQAPHRKGGVETGARAVVE